LYYYPRSRTMCHCKRLAIGRREALSSAEGLRKKHPWRSLEYCRAIGMATQSVMKSIAIVQTRFAGRLIICRMGILAGRIQSPFDTNAALSGKNTTLRGRGRDGGYDDMIRPLAQSPGRGWSLDRRGGPKNC
jgi:hypothetical protein